MRVGDGVHVSWLPRSIERLSHPVDVEEQVLAVARRVVDHARLNEIE